VQATTKPSIDVRRSLIGLTEQEATTKLKPQGYTLRKLTVDGAVKLDDRRNNVVPDPSVVTVDIENGKIVSSYPKE
jgi:hypothetical protein